VCRIEQRLVRVAEQHRLALRVGAEQAMLTLAATVEGGTNDDDAKHSRSSKLRAGLANRRKK